jgi:SAM-dependent methyltransferase
VKGAKLDAKAAIPRDGWFASVTRLLNGFFGTGWDELAADSGEAEDFDPLIYSLWRGMVPPRPLWEVPGDPFVHFVRWAFEYRAYLPLLCGLARDSVVLELGCSFGRTMLGLIGYLKAPGRYEGFDAIAARIEFAQKHIHSVYNEFNFTFANVYNARYNASPGAIAPERFRFPYADNTFDVAYAASLFTHLLPSAVENYFRETRRTLKKGAKCLFSFFILDYYRGPGTSAWVGYEFNHALPGVEGIAIMDKDLPENSVAYRSELIAETARRSGFSLNQILPGDWSKSAKVAVHEQDLVVLQAV